MSAPGYTHDTHAIWMDCGGCPERAAANEANDALWPEPAQPAMPPTPIEEPEQALECDGCGELVREAMLSKCPVTAALYCPCCVEIPEEALGEAEEIEMAIIEGLEGL